MPRSKHANDAPRLVVRCLKDEPGKIMPGCRYYACVHHRDGRTEHRLGRVVKRSGRLFFEKWPLDKAAGAAVTVDLLARVLGTIFGP